MEQRVSAIIQPTIYVAADYFSLAIPIKIAARMADDLGRSIITRGPAVTYPEHRVKLQSQALRASAKTSPTASPPQASS